MKPSGLLSFRKFAATSQTLFISSNQLRSLRRITRRNPFLPYLLYGLFRTKALESIVRGVRSLASLGSSPTGSERSQRSRGVSYRVDASHWIYHITCGDVAVYKLDRDLESLRMKIVECQGLVDRLEIAETKLLYLGQVTQSHPGSHPITRHVAGV